MAHSLARRRLTNLIAAVAAAVLVYLLLPTQGDWAVNEAGRRTAVVFVIAAVCWATEALPLYATSLGAIGLLVVLLDPKSALVDPGKGIAEAVSRSAWPEGEWVTSGDLFAQFGSNIIMLFMGGFLLSAALTKHGIDKKIAARVLLPFARSPMLLLYGVLGVSALFSMWMSNTATAAMMIAIIRPLLKDVPKGDVFHRAVVLAVPFGANIGGIATPIGTPPNAVAFGAINAWSTQPGGPDPVSFLQWMAIALPLAVVLLAAAGQLLYWTHRPGPGLKFAGKLAVPAFTWRGRVTIGVLLVAVTLWLTGTWHGLSAGAVALLAAAALTTCRVLDREDVDHIDWNILILMWGGLALGEAVARTGMTDLIGQVDLGALPGGAMVIAAIVVTLAIGLSTFMSNTATANLLIPVVLALPLGSVDARLQMGVIAALGCSFAMALPVSTPPNAIAFATGEVRATELFRLGGLTSVVSGIVLVLGYQFVLPLVLGG